MEKKAFKTESKKMLDMMINSIYTHKEIFLRELISNASDAIDKRAFRALTDSALGLDRSEYAIEIIRDKSARTLTLRDNGCGMTQEELENNLGTIAKSGSLDFKYQCQHRYQHRCQHRCQHQFQHRWEPLLQVPRLRVHRSRALLHRHH